MTPEQIKEINEISEQIYIEIVSDWTEEKIFDVESENYTAQVKWIPDVKYNPGDYYHEPEVSLKSFAIYLEDVYTENGHDQEAYDVLNKKINDIKFHWHV